MNGSAILDRPRISRTEIDVFDVGTAAMPRAWESRLRSPWDEVVEKLSTLFSLRDNWDGMGAVAPSGALVQSAVELIDTLRQLDFPPPSTAVATPAGTVLFGWHNDPAYFEIEVVAPYRAESMTIDEYGNVTHDEVFSR
jgi:hypothetical protein